MLQSNSYIGFRLTGKVSQELTQGYGLHCFRMRTGEWDMDMCKELGVDPSFLPDIYASHDIIGTVTEKAAAECGLTAGIPVVAGALDAACGTLGAGVIHPGETQEQGGQAGGMSICMDTYKADERLILSYHAAPNQWILQRNRRRRRCYALDGTGVCRLRKADRKRDRKEFAPDF